MRAYPVWALVVFFVVIVGCADDAVPPESESDVLSGADISAEDVAILDIATNDGTTLGGEKDVGTPEDVVAPEVDAGEPDTTEIVDTMVIDSEEPAEDIIEDVESVEDVEEPPVEDTQTEDVQPEDVPPPEDVTPPAPCQDNTDCEEGWVCDKPDCSIQAGTCVSMPTTCVDVEDFQCGCDELTYTNDCERLLAGVGLAYLGECIEVDAPCVSDEDSCAPGQFCLAPGCGPGLVGSCQPMPSFCNDGFEGVCGCDGVTYSSQCAAHSEGVVVAGTGSCPEGGFNCEVAVGFGQGTGCEPGQYCMGGCEGVGFCKDKGPFDCSGVPMSVVCSCANNSYGNLCLAQSAGVNVDYAGWCEGDSGTPEVTPCAGFLELQCEEGQHCNIESCDELAEGTCMSVWTPSTPGILCMPWDSEECGCDGVTYANYCQRAIAGTGKAYDGPCTDDGNPNTCLLGHVGDCGTGLYCSGPLGQCDGEGVCKSTDFLCVLGPHQPDVCGCDGVTYDSTCNAQQADIPIQFLGACP